MTNKVGVFAQRLEQHCKSRNLRSSRWWGASTQTANLLAVRTVPLTTVLYVKDRTDAPGFWGLNSNQLHSLEHSQVDWGVVLLVGPKEDGYFLPSDRVRHCVESNRWSFSKTDWKVHEAELLGERSFSSFEQLFDLLLA